MKYNAVDLLSSEYGWTKHYILEQVYFDDYVELAIRIRQRTIADYKFQLRIVMNPHVEDPNELVEMLNDIDEVLAIDSSPKEEKLDKAGFHSLKLLMADNPRIIVK